MLTNYNNKASCVHNHRKVFGVIIFFIVLLICYQCLVNSSTTSIGLNTSHVRSLVITTPTLRPSQNISYKNIKMSKTKKLNLTALTWAHAVNSYEQLKDALQSDVDMIEADIVLGTELNMNFVEPIMAHPPNNTSDLSLYSFLRQIEEYNDEKNIKSKKGIKLDFKSIEAFEDSLNMLAEKIPEMSYPIWLNADIIPGPIEDNNAIPVDPDRFLYACYEFKNAVLSVGWTTKWSSEFNDGSYTDEHIEAMIEAIREQFITQSDHALTFPVRAGIAANSITQLHKLVGELNETNDCTLTIWSSPNDYVDVEKLELLILSFGLDRVYLDVPEELLQKLNLSPKRDQEDTKDAADNGGGSATAGTLLHFSLMSAGLFVLSLFLERFHA